jgi:hypothetical protein
MSEKKRMCQYVFSCTLLLTPGVEGLIVDDEFCTSRHSTSALFAAGCCCCWLLFSTGMNDLQACAFVLLFPDELWRVLTALPTVAVEGAAAAAGVPAVAFFVTIGFLGAPRFGIVVDGVVIERVYAVVNDTERLSLQLPAVEEEFAAGWCGLFFPSVLAAPTIDYRNDEKMNFHKI